MRQAHVLVAGGGIGGLTAALALHARGIEADVYEQAANPREVGAGVQIAPNGARVLCALGLGPAMEAIASVPAGKEVRLFSTGQAWKLQDLGTEAVARWGAPYWMAHRGDFHRVLMDAFAARAPGRLHTGARVAAVEQDRGGASLVLESGERVGADAVIGADGVHSRVRQSLFAETPADFTGIIAWRGVVPMARVPAHMRAPLGLNWIGPHGHVVMYPLRRGELLNMVGAVERDDWRVESWSVAGTTEECLHDLGAWHADVHAIIRQIETPYKWALLSRDALARWSVGRVTLLGDACHPTLPFLAQGANMALEDAMVLARCIERDEADIPAALLRYEQARLDRTTRIVRGALDNAKRFHNPELASAEGAQAYVDREFEPAKVEARYNWLFEYDAVTTELEPR